VKDPSIPIRSVEEIAGFLRLTNVMTNTLKYARRLLRFPFLTLAAMRPLPLLAVVLCLAGTTLAPAKEGANTALGAIKQLPRGEYKKIVRIEGRDGSPAPERWHIIVHDPKDENGVHEYVIASGELVASRAISQFVESVKADDVVRESLVKIDSDKLGALATEYATVNNVPVASFNYALKKEGVDAVPLWSVTCLDDQGRQVGQLVVSAGKGNVISHEGFTAEPGPEVMARLETQQGEDDRRFYQKKVVRATPAATPAAEKKDILSKMGNSINKFFTGKKP
jgi:hypothetical protein